MNKMILAAGIATAGLLATGTGVTAALADDTPPSCQTGCVTVFVPPGAGPHMPFGIAHGPLGSEWFADGPANTIDRVNQRGAITAYQVPTPGANPGWVTVDDSGSVWFAERFAGKIGEITPDGTITEFPLPSPSALPQGIVAAPDGNLYITEQGTNAIARLDPATSQVTQFPVPTPAATPLGLALGPGRGAVVHRAVRQQDRPDHHRRRPHRIPPARWPGRHHRRQGRPPVCRPVLRPRPRPGQPVRPDHWALGPARRPAGRHRHRPDHLGSRQLRRHGLPRHALHHQPITPAHPRRRGHILVDVCAALD